MEWAIPSGSNVCKGTRYLISGIAVRDTGLYSHESLKMKGNERHRKIQDCAF
jgi:hypothetical protein